MITGQDLKLEPIKFKDHNKKDQKLEELIYKLIKFGTVFEN